MSAIALDPNEFGFIHFSITFLIKIVHSPHSGLFTVTEWDGEVLEVARISRLDMGSYLCIGQSNIQFYRNISLLIGTWTGDGKDF